MGFLAPTIKTSVSVGQTSEFAATSSEYGADIPRVYGTDRLNGNLIWWSDIRLIKSTDTQTQGGKGGPKQQTTTTTYEYFVDLAVAFAEGIATQLLRIWADGKVIYDATGPSIDTIDGLNFRFYRGTETQLPDTLIESVEGENNVSAHRGLVYVVFENLDLSDFGNRIPALSAEIAFDNTASSTSASLVDFDLTGDGSTETNFLDDRAIFGTDGRLYLTALDTSDNSAEIRSFILSPGTISNTQIPTVGTDAGFTLTNVAAVQPDGTVIGSVFEGNNSTPGQRFNVGTNGPFDINNVTRFTSTALLPGEEDYMMVGADGTPTTTGRTLVIDLRLLDTGENINGNAQAIVAELPNENVALRGYTIAGDNVLGFGQAYHVFLNTSNQIEIRRGQRNGIVVLDQISASEVIAGETGFEDNTSELLWCAWDPALGRIIIAATCSINGNTIFSWSPTAGVQLLNTGLPFRPKRQEVYDGNGARLTGQSLVWCDAAGRVIRMLLNDGSLDNNFDGTEVVLEDASNRVITWDEPTSTLWVDSGEQTNNYPRIYGYSFNSGEGQDINPRAIIEDLCSLAGLQEDEIDTTGVPVQAEGIKSLVRRERTEYSTLIQNLLDLLAYTVVETDGKLVFRQKGQPNSVTVPVDDLVVSGSREGEEFVRSILRERELPRVFEVNYTDSENNYQPNVQRDQRPSEPVSAVVSDNIEQFDYSGSGVADSFQAAAVRELYSIWAEIDRFQYRLPPKYLSVTATDTITLDVEAVLFQGRIRSSDLGADFTTDIEKVVEVDGQYTVIGAGDGGSAFDREIPNTGSTTALLLNLPLLRDTDTGGQEVSIYYWGGTGAPIWPGAILYQLSGTSIAQNIGTSVADMPIGTTDEAVPDPTTTTVFEDTSVTFSATFPNGVDLFESATKENVLQGANALAVVKANGETELLQFINAELVSETTIRFSGLLRGRRGTEPYATGHAAGETIALVTTTNAQVISNATTSLNSPIDYVSPTLGQLFENATEFSFTQTGEDLKPYSPVGLQLTNPGTPDGVDISWVRRTRIGGELSDGSDVPLSEQSESYEVDILDGPGGSVLRTLTSTTESVNYSTADITTDFGSLPSAIDVVVYQISGAVGRGKPAIASLETT